MTVKTHHRGFTLIELLVVIVIVAALATLAFMFSQRALLKGQKVTVMQQMRDVSTGMEAYSLDYKRPPVPQSRLDTGTDTVYGNPEGEFGSEIIIGALLGENDTYETGTDEIFSAREINPRENQYIAVEIVDDNRGGVGAKDGKFYDLWGNEIMFAINTPAYREEDNDGRYDKILHTFGLGEWKDKKPRFERYAMWSYGKDGEKGEFYSKSDDVAYF
ncbi:general secretion pathway protein GspG [Haloferula helveola]|uniref:General secretion pathway protein GspG n=1 Tax=Haloferula helveola TaxID=490095 RepID=A0ABM7RIU0_9BACT|nr:general secretion pathway protein GspG [Haloferula helveola]